MKGCNLRSHIEVQRQLRFAATTVPGSFSERGLGGFVPRIATDFRDHLALNYRKKLSLFLVGRIIKERSSYIHIYVKFLLC